MTRDIEIFKINALNNGAAVNIDPYFYQDPRVTFFGLLYFTRNYQLFLHRFNKDDESFKPQAVHLLEQSFGETDLTPVYSMEDYDIPEIAVSLDLSIIVFLKVLQLNWLSLSNFNWTSSFSRLFCGEIFIPPNCKEVFPEILEKYRISCMARGGGRFKVDIELESLYRSCEFSTLVKCHGNNQQVPYVLTSDKTFSKLLLSNIGEKTGALILDFNNFFPISLSVNEEDIKLYGTYKHELTKFRYNVENIVISFINSLINLFDESAFVLLKSILKQELNWAIENLMIDISQKIIYPRATCVSLILITNNNDLSVLKDKTYLFSHDKYEMTISVTKNKSAFSFPPDCNFGLSNFRIVQIE